jgi:hypothetical protein
LICDDETLAGFRLSDPDGVLLALVERLVARARAHNLWEDLTAIVVLQDADLTPLADLLGSVPVDWDWREDDGAWLALGKTAGNSGFAWIVLRRRGDDLK